MEARALTAKEPGWNQPPPEFSEGVVEPTTSFDSLMSTLAVVNSHTSRKSTSIASASASASSIDLMSKRKTKSPPYLARSFGGGLGLIGDLAGLVHDAGPGGIRHTVWMRLSRTRDSQGLSLVFCGKLRGA